ncbi:MAG: transcriptional repressor [Vampirovibrio sp.]
MKTSVLEPTLERSIGTAQDLLQQFGLRQTECRRQVLDTILASQTPLSHAEVVQRLASQAFDRATLYRNLIYLVDAGLLERHHFGDHVWRFSLHTHLEEKRSLPSLSEEASHHHHPHFVCERCHGVDCYAFAVDLETILGLENKKDLPFIHELVLRGICKTCR